MDTSYERVPNGPIVALVARSGRIGEGAFG